MNARFRKLLADLQETFWLIPALLVGAGAVAALGLIHIDRSGIVPKRLLENWLYDGGATGARTLFGVVASSTIGVAGTVFSITIAALSLAAGQMGPRLLRNFIRDRGNQLTLGAFLGTFCFALIVLRSVRTETEGGLRPAPLAQRLHRARVRLRQRAASVLRRSHGGPHQRRYRDRTGQRRRPFVDRPFDGGGATTRAAAAFVLAGSHADRGFPAWLPPATRRRRPRRLGG